MRRPALRWHGGKWKLAPWIISHFPEHKVYVEPFGGGASVLLRKSRSYAEVYNDLDGDVVNFFRVMRDNGSALLASLQLTPFAREEHNISYTHTECAIERARRTVIRSFMGFGSNGVHAATGFRSNSNRSGTTPAKDWANYPQFAEEIVKRLQGVVIENRDGIEVIKQHDSEHTLHYVDPPYVASTRDPGRDYAHEMTDNDHEQLIALLNSIKGKSVISGYRCEMYDDLLSGWFRVDRTALADGARRRVESLWLSFDPIQPVLFAHE